MSSIRAINCLKCIPKLRLLTATQSSRSLVTSVNRETRNLLRANERDRALGSSLLSTANAHTKADKDLSLFLEKEIVLERNQSKAPKAALRVPGFEVSEDGSNVMCTRKVNDETITVKLNVNASVDPEESELPEDYNPQEGETPQMSEMKSKPDFSVEIRKSNGRTLALNCSFYRGPSDELENDSEAAAEKEDLFQIENFYILNQDDVIKDNQLRDNVYIGDGEIIDGEMYELLMNYLDEKGVTNEFAEHLMEYCTHYEHKQYINLLSNLKSFIEGK